MNCRGGETDVLAVKCGSESKGICRDMSESHNGLTVFH